MSATASDEGDAKPESGDVERLAEDPDDERVLRDERPERDDDDLPELELLERLDRREDDWRSTGTYCSS